MAYKVLEAIALPEMEGDVATGNSIRKEPGDTITKDEMKKAGQSDEAIKALIESGAIEEGGK